MSLNRKGNKTPSVDIKPSLSTSSITRAILIPKSDSATYSVHLENQQCCISSIPEYKPLLSPISTEDETASRKLTNTKLLRSKKKREPGQLTIVLKQSQIQEKFILGSSTDNDVFLKHPDASMEDLCYINLHHCQLYPDPDCSAIVLYNNSTSIFAVHPVSARLFNNNLLPGHEAQLGSGNWWLMLGAGLVYEIRVLPFPPSEALAAVAMPTKKATIITGLGTIRRAMKQQLLTGEASFDKEKVTQKARVIHEVSKPQPQPAETEPPRPQSVGTERPSSLLVKTRRNNVVVAVKICRKPQLKQSADTWRNERDILLRLCHPSIISLIDYDARSLTLNLEYIGNDLATFVDEYRISRILEDIKHKIFKDISQGIQYIHEMRILHLDIKPENILLGQDNRVVLCDFGSSLQGAVGPISNNGGMPCYIPPEYLLNDQRGSPGDVWAFGVTMLFVFGLITLPHGNWRIADVPLDHDTHQQMADWLQTVQRVSRTLPKALALLQSMLIVNPKKRITGKQLANSFLEAVTSSAIDRELIA